MNRPERWQKILKPMLVGAGLAYILMYVLTALARMAYPYELEAMEGGMVDHVLHILSGEKLYGPPSLHFVPYAYPPVYYYVAAALSRLLSAGFLPLRLVSFLASLGIMGLIYLFVRRETNERSWALLAAAFFAATFRLSDAWFDLARIDSLFLFLVLLFAYLVRFHPSRIAYAFAALALFLALFTKQSALLIALPLLAYAILLEKPQGKWLLALSAALIGGGLWGMNALHQGWYKYYIFDLTGQRWMEKLIGRRIIGFWTEDMLKPLSVAVFLFLAFLLFECGAERKKRLFFYTAFASGMIGTAWFSRLEYGAYGNALIPAYAMLAIGFGLAMARFWQGAALPKTAGHPILNVFLFAMGAIQFALLAYNPLLLVPSAADRRAGDHLVKTLAQLPGDIMVPGHGFLPHLAGKPRYAHEVAVKNLIKIDNGPVKSKLEKEFSDAIAGKRFNALVLDRHEWLRPFRKHDYVFGKAVFSDPKVFWPVTGKRLRPNFVYFPSKY